MFIIVPLSLINLSWSYHDLVMILSWSCHDLVMILSWSCHDLVMILSWSCHDLVMILLWSYELVMVLSWSYHGLAMILSWSYDLIMILSRSCKKNTMPLAMILPFLVECCRFLLVLILLPYFFRPGSLYKRPQSCNLPHVTVLSWQPVYDSRWLYLVLVSQLSRC